MSDPVIMTTATSSQPKLQQARSHVSLDADIIIKNAPDPVFVSDLEGKILSANDAVYELLGFRTDEVLEQSLSRFISPQRRASLPPRCARSLSAASFATRASIPAAPLER